MWDIVVAVFTSKIFIAVLTVLLTTLLGIYFYLTRHFGKYEKLYDLPALKPVPIFGTEIDYLLGRKSTNDVVLQNYRAFEGHKLGLIYQGSRPSIVIRDVEILKHITIKDFEHFNDFFIEEVEAAGIGDETLIFSFGEKWRRAKSALHQAFRVRHVKDVLPKLDFCIRRSLDQLDTYAKTGEAFQMDLKVVQPLFLDCIGHAVCGVQIDAARDTESEFTKMIGLLQSSVFRLVLLFVAPELMCFFKIPVFDDKASSYLRGLIQQLLKDHKEKKIYDDMMGVHVRLQEETEKKQKQEPNNTELIPMTDHMIIGSVMQFFFDGILTAGTVIEAGLYFLAKHPELQDKAYEEIQQVMGDRMSEGSSLADLPMITDEDLLNMKYVEQIYDESARFGCFPFVSRNCTKDYIIPGTNIKVPKGFPVYLPILGFHMDEKYFPEPDRFNPDRFSPENRGNIVGGTYFPFGQGPRMCLGKNFARIEGKSFLANLLRSFKIHIHEKSVKNLEWSVEGSGKIKGGLWVTVTRREN